MRHRGSKKTYLTASGGAGKTIQAQGLMQVSGVLVSLSSGDQGRLESNHVQHRGLWTDGGWRQFTRNRKPTSAVVKDTVLSAKSSAVIQPGCDNSRAAQQLHAVTANYGAAQHGCEATLGPSRHLLMSSPLHSGLRWSAPVCSTRYRWCFSFS